MDVFSNSVRLRIFRICYKLDSSPGRLRTIATSTHTDTAIQICIFNALAEVPTKVLTRNYCFNARENNSTCQRCLWMRAKASARYWSQQGKCFACRSAKYRATHF